MKKLSLFIALLCMCTAQIYAVDFTYNGVKYSIETATTSAVALSAVSGGNGNIVIPATIPYNNVSYSVVKVNPWAFSGNSDITSVNVDAKDIDHEAFQLCGNLTSVTIGNNVVSLGYWAFRQCPKLTSITIGTGLKQIVTSAFAENSSLKTFNVAAGNTAFLSEDGVLFDKNKIGIYCYPAGKTETGYTIPNTVTTIMGAFYGAANLTSVTIPASVITLNSESFNYCSKLTELYCYAATPPTVSGQNAFVGLNAACTLYVPANSIEKYKAATGWSVFFSRYKIDKLPDGSAIDDVAAADPVVSSRYYNLSGKEVAQLQDGCIYIVKELRQSGLVTVSKKIR